MRSKFRLMAIALACAGGVMFGASAANAASCPASGPSANGTAQFTLSPTVTGSNSDVTCGFESQQQGISPTIPSGYTLIDKNDSTFATDPTNNLKDGALVIGFNGS